MMGLPLEHLNKLTMKTKKNSEQKGNNNRPYNPYR